MYSILHMHLSRRNVPVPGRTTLDYTCVSMQGTITVTNTGRLGGCCTALCTHLFTLLCIYIVVAYVQAVQCFHIYCAVRDVHGSVHQIHIGLMDLYGPERIHCALIKLLRKLRYS